MPVTNITIYTDLQDAVHKLYDVANRLHIKHNIELRIAWVPAHSAVQRNEWAHSEVRTALKELRFPRRRSKPFFGTAFYATDTSEQFY